MTSAYRYIAEGMDPKREKIYYRGESMTGLDVLRDVSDLAAYLSCLGVRQGDVVSVALPNIPQAIIALYAAESIGAVVNLLSPRLGKEALAKAVQGSKVLFLPISLWKKSKNIMLPKIFCGVTEYGLLPFFLFLSPFLPATFTHAVHAGRSLPRPVNFGEGSDGPAVLLHSAGTTEEPKVVALSSEALNNLSENVMAAVKEITDADKGMGMLATLPVFHGFGLGIGIHLAMRYIRCLPQPQFSANKAIRLMKETKVSVLAGVPSMFKKLAENKKFDGPFLKNIELVFCGGDRLDPAIKEKFESVLEKNGSRAKVMEGYGMSETASVVTINVAHPDNGSLGQPLPGVEIALDDGEILVRSDSMMLGYYENGTVTPCTKEYQGKEYFPTGDIGRITDGDLYFIDRKKRIVKIGGNNVYPGEIERIAVRFPKISDAVAVRTTYQGKPAVKLLVVTEENLDAFLPDLRKFIEDNASRYAVPRIVEKVKEIKKTAMGKADYRYYEEQEK